MLKIERLESQIICKVLGAIKPKGLNRIAKIATCVNDAVLRSSPYTSNIMAASSPGGRGLEKIELSVLYLMTIYMHIGL
jgi:hypothetical protein